jgi:hypothetical protein
MHNPFVLACSFSFVAVLPAQKPIDAKAFLPTDYRNVVFVDLATIRKKGVWDELEASVLKAAFKQIEKESGIELKALDRLTAVAVPGADDAERRSNQPPDHTEVFVLEGNVRLGMSESVRQNWAEEQVGAFATRVQRGGMNTMCVAPKPEVLVTGSESIVRPVLEGKPNAGLPCADVMSLLSGRAEPLAYFVFDVAAPFLAEHLLHEVFPDAVWADGQSPVFLCVRVLATGDADDPHLVLEAVLRHTAAGPGMDVSAKAADALLERLAAMPQMRAVKPVLRRVEKKRDRSDLVYSLDLGRTRDAIGQLAVLALPMFMPYSVETTEAVRAASVDPAPAPVPAPKK